MKEELDVIEGAKDAFGLLTTLKRDRPERFDAVAEDFVVSGSKNAGVWRYLAMHFIRIGRYDLAAVAANSHLSLSPGSNEAFLRRYRIALLAADRQVAQTMLEEQKSRLGGFQFECSRFLFLRRFEHAGTSGAPSIVELRELASFELNRVLMRELRGDPQEAQLSDQPIPAKAGGEPSSIDNLGKFARALALVDGVDKLVVLGNGGSLRGAKLGAYLDSQDCVVRINFPKITGMAEDVGAKTNLVFFTEAFLHTPDNLNALQELRSAYPNVPGVAIDAARTNRIEDLAGFGDIPENIALAPVGIRSLIRALSYDFATTGLCGLVLLSVLFRKDIETYGFDFYSPTTDVHFFSRRPSAVFIGHETAFEQFLASVAYASRDPMAQAS